MEPYQTSEDTMTPTEAMFIANHQDTNLGGTVGWNLTNRGTVGWNLINESKVTKPCKPEIRRTTQSFTNRQHQEAMFRHNRISQRETILYQ